MTTDATPQVDRRTFLQATAGTGAAAALGGVARGAESGRELLVGFSGTTTAEAVRTELPAGAEPIRQDEDLGFVLVELEADSYYSQVRTTSEIAAIEGVRYTEPNEQMHAFEVRSSEAGPASDPKFGQQYAPQQVKAPEAWNTTPGSSEVTIAVVDQGVKYDHPDLKAQFGSNKGKDFVDGDDDPYPKDMAEEYHGTHVAGIAAATKNNGEGIAGVADATLLSVRVLDTAGTGNTADIAKGVKWAADQGADFINMSLGGGGFAQTMKNAVKYAVRKGTLPICASGNSGLDSVSYPARYAECVAVGATDDQKERVRFSQYGENLDVMAPGSYVLSCWTESNNEYNEISGTSMACPAATGVAALGKAAHPSLTPDQSRALLKGTAVDLGIPEAKQGFGLVDAKAVVTTDVSNFSPSAGYSTDVAHPDPGETITFDASTTSDPEGSISSYRWTFGDGTTKTGKKVTHTYSEAGDYDATLTVTDRGGKTDSVTKAISVQKNETPTASIAPNSPSALVGEEIYFRGRYSEDPDGTVESYEWDFGDGATATGGFIHHTYDAPGEYTVELTVTDDDGATATATETATISKNGAPSAAFSVSPENPTVEDRVEVDAGDSSDPNGSIESYDWAFGDGGTDSGESAAHVYDSPGEYTIELTVTDGQGNTSSASKTVSVGSGSNDAPTAVLQVGDDTTAPGTAVTFEATASADPDGSITAYDWAFGDGATGSGEVVDHTYSETGEYTVELTVTDDAGATDAATGTVTVTESGGGDGNGGGGDGSCTDPTDRMVETGTLESRDDSATFEYDVRSAEPCEVVLSMVGDVGTDFDLYATLDGREPTTSDYDLRSWGYGSDEEITVGEEDLGSDTTLGILVDAYSSSGEFELTVAEAGRGSDGNTAPTPDIRVWGDSVTVGSATTFDGTQSTDSNGRVETYEWEFGDGATATGAQTTHTYSEAGDYDVTLTVTDDDGASAATAKTVTVEDGDDEDDDGDSGDEDCMQKAGATMDGSMNGAGDRARFEYLTRSKTPCQVVVTLSGPDGTDFDLYLTDDGSVASSANYDRKSSTPNSEERIVVDSVSQDQTFGLAVESWSGAGSFTLGVEELGE